MTVRPAPEAEACFSWEGDEKRVTIRIGPDWHEITLEQAISLMIDIGVALKQASLSRERKAPELESDRGSEE